MKTAHELALAAHAIANAICDGAFPNRLNHAPSDINLAAAMPVAFVEADIVRRDRDGSRPMVDVENLLLETWPEFFVPRHGPQLEHGFSQFRSTLADVHVT
jgi:hypothetical protein